ncbi:hypothetical protein Pcinc_040690 [Petrolisthes cinctipes]|uniref:Uncharacterized protein n=1 Tax=Petrolisthes cinctipes TaxID=88211 RepID=A0AAE1EHS4_PETCI|nr:hypothetical protein Pcinc_040690 [Petrolisthes cinctipes]
MIKTELMQIPTSSANDVPDRVITKVLHEGDEMGGCEVEQGKVEGDGTGDGGSQAYPSTSSFPPLRPTPIHLLLSFPPPHTHPPPPSLLSVSPRLHALRKHGDTE